MREIERVRDAVSSQTIPLVYFWYGEDRFLLQEALHILKQTYLMDDPSGSGIETVSGREFEPFEIVEKVNTLSFFQKRLVIVEQIPYFQDGFSSDLEVFYHYFQNPNPNACLLFMAEKIHRGKKFFKEISKMGEVLEFGFPKRIQDWRLWIQKELDERGKSMSPGAMGLFLEWVGHQPGIVSSELDKLAVFAGERKRITEDDVRGVTTRTIEANVFNLVDAVAERALDKALHRLHDVLREEHPLKVLTLLVRQVRLLLGAAAWRKKGGNAAEVGAALGIRSSFEAQKIWSQSQKIAEPILERALSECLKTELALKRSGGDPVLLLEILIANFCKKQDV